MRAVIQRVSEAVVSVAGEVVSSIGPGLMVLVGMEASDDGEDIAWLTRKMVQLRIFNDAQGVMNLPLTEVGGEVMLVSQFTLHASTKKGNRPSYIRAARPETAVPLYESLLVSLEEALGKPVARGIFGADMKVALVNDGPVTIILDSRQREF
ncbi:MAG TPA: D-aminoacyl-tRNA deacylase [Prolixibacteraceae bacterium]|nr:D-aminoacyl-tRNA deacylase [Prolixibacteraceae bacterium]